MHGKIRMLIVFNNYYEMANPTRLNKLQDHVKLTLNGYLLTLNCYCSQLA